MIKIGIDARSLSRPITGVGRYTFDMSRQLALNNDIELYLYSPAPILPQYRDPFQNCYIREFSKPKNGVFRQVWGETVLPYWAKKDDLDVLWGPSHRLPRIIPKHCKAIVTIHDLVWKVAGETMKTASRIRESIQMPSVVKSADCVVVSSNATINDLNTFLNVPLEKMSLVYPAIDLNTRLDVPEKHHVIDQIVTSPKYILFVGTLEPRKNIIRLLEAYSKLGASVQHACHLVIVGGTGWGNEKLDVLVNKIELNDFIHLMGYLDEQSLQYLYKNAHILAMPSTYEGFGLPIAEAMKFGTPAIAGNNSSLMEVVGDAGLLVDAKSVEEISQGLLEMISNDKIHHAFAANTRKQVEKFEAVKSAADLLDVFIKAVKE